MKMILFALALTFLCATFADAGPIGAACMDSARNSASSHLCGCIQQVADKILPSADQRRAASFFANPDKAQQVRMSKSSNDNAFWQRYVSFGDAAAQTCQN
ncbi:hypothetical protein GALL_501190 [mine drainage metagenome]|uniref:Uncharacterized protein n=1 Tax=mine drainage metagenome TaxID=410659 RepID=A0A1J5P9M2_9ZZZZ